MSNAIELPPFAVTPTALLRDPFISMQAKALYSLLSTFTGEDGRRVFPGQPLQAKYLGVSTRTIKTLIAELSDSGWVSVSVEKTPTGRRNRYALLMVCSDGVVQHGSPSIVQAAALPIVKQVAPEEEPLEEEPLEEEKKMTTSSSAALVEDSVDFSPAELAIAAGVKARLDAGAHSWDLPAIAATAWAEVVPPGDVSGGTRFLAAYWVAVNGDREGFSWPRAGKLCRTYGRFALFGLNAALAADADDPWVYATSVARKTVAEVKP